MKVFEGNRREIQAFLVPNLSQLQHSCHVFRLNYNTITLIYMRALSPSGGRLQLRVKPHNEVNALLVFMLR